jgi:glycerol-3-phosphate cytidylyltransferase
MSRVVYTGGTFDLFHVGHVAFLHQCRTIAGDGGRVVVALNTDEFIAEFKSGPPVMTYAERVAVLESCRYVDQVVPNIGGHDSKPAISEVKPHFIVIGDDWAQRDYYAQMDFTPAWLAERDILLLYVPRYRGVSTTDIKRRLRAAP